MSGYTPSNHRFLRCPLDLILVRHDYFILLDEPVVLRLVGFSIFLQKMLYLANLPSLGSRHFLQILNLLSRNHCYIIYSIFFFFKIPYPIKSYEYEHTFHVALIKSCIFGLLGKSFDLWYLVERQKTPAMQRPRGLLSHCFRLLFSDNSVALVLQSLTNGPIVLAPLIRAPVFRTKHILLLPSIFKSSVNPNTSILLVTLSKS